MKVARFCFNYEGFNVMQYEEVEIIIFGYILYCFWLFTRLEANLIVYIYIYMYKF